jgi:hypothetical protein
MIIKSQSGDSASSPWFIFVVLWGSVAAASFLISLLTAAPGPSFLTLAISRPIYFAVAFLMVVSVFSRFAGWQFFDQLARRLFWVPPALLAGVALASVGVWNDGSGTVALPLPQALAFIGSLGVYPFQSGPEALLRGSVVALAVLFVWNFHQQARVAWDKAVGVGIVAWLGASAVLLIQTWLAQVASWTRHIPIMHTQDAFQVLSLIHLDSYWSNFQADRFFAAVGKQLEINLALSSASLLFVLAVAWLFYQWLNARSLSWRDFFKLFGAQPLPVIAAGGLAGLSLGWKTHQLAWSAPDIVSLGLGLVVFGLWYGFIFLKFSAEESMDKSALIILLVLGGLLLGWPIMFLVLSLLALHWIYTEKLWRWSESKYGSAAHLAVMSAGSVLLAGTFAFRNATLSVSTFRAAAVWGILGALTALLADQSIGNFKLARYQLAWKYIFAAIAGLLAALLLRTPVVLAALALWLLFLIWSQKKAEAHRLSVLWSVLIFGWVSMLLAFFVKI